MPIDVLYVSFFPLPLHCQHPFVAVEHRDILYQLVQRTKEAVRLVDHLNFKRFKRLLIEGGNPSDECTGEDDVAIESEPPRLGQEA